MNLVDIKNSVDMCGYTSDAKGVSVYATKARYSSYELGNDVTIERPNGHTVLILPANENIKVYKLSGWVDNRLYLGVMNSLTDNIYFISVYRDLDYGSIRVNIEPINGDIPLYLKRRIYNIITHGTKYRITFLIDTIKSKFQRKRFYWF